MGLHRLILTAPRGWRTEMTKDEGRQADSEYDPLFAYHHPAAANVLLDIGAAVTHSVPSRWHCEVAHCLLSLHMPTAGKVLATPADLDGIHIVLLRHPLRAAAGLVR